MDYHNNFSHGHNNTINKLHLQCNPNTYNQYDNTLGCVTNSIPAEILNVKKKVIKRVIGFDSKFRTNLSSYDSYNFNVSFPLKNVVSLRLSSLELPESWYVFSSKTSSNLFDISSSVWNSGNLTTIVLPEGNYDISTFETALANAINSALGTGYRFVVNIDPINNKTTITDLSGYDFTLDFSRGGTIDPITRSLGWYMGFRNTKYTDDSSYTSEGLFNNKNDYMYFVLEDGNISDTTSYIGFLKNSYLDNDILGRIVMPSDKYQVTYDDGHDYNFKKRCYSGPVNINRLVVKLLDEYGGVLDLNKMDFSFSLELEIEV